MIELFSLPTTLLIIAFILGIKHSFDADHIVAVSSILSRAPSVKRSSSLSFAWSIGHMLTATIITFLLFTFKSIFLEPLLNNFELAVAFMLIFIAVFTIAWEFDIIKFGKHTHGHAHTNGTVHSHDNTINEEKPVSKEYEHSHLHVMSFKREHKTMSGIGVIHGLASNDELLLLITLSLGFTDYLPIFLGVFLFTFGVVIGMIGYSIFLNYPMLRWGQENVARTVNLTVAVISIFYAGYILIGGETINLLPFIPEL